VCLSLSLHVARVGKMKHVHTILTGNPEERRPLRSPRFLRGDIIEVDVRKVCLEGEDCIRLGHDSTSDGLI
jgi:hypothetical protein